MASSCRFRTASRSTSCWSRARSARPSSSAAKLRCSKRPPPPSDRWWTRTSISNLPMNGRAVYLMARIVPGMVPTDTRLFTRPFDNGAVSNVSMGGSRAGNNNILLDGISNMNITSQVAFVPSPDAIQEMKVQINTYDAEFGRAAGGVLNAIVKSGTNQFHGSLYEFWRNDKLEANSFINNSVDEEQAAPALQPVRRHGRRPALHSQGLRRPQPHVRLRQLGEHPAGRPHLHAHHGAHARAARRRLFEDLRPAGPAAGDLRSLSPGAPTPPWPAASCAIRSPATAFRAAAWTRWP